ncbi:MAG: type II toxin-antitoxin system Y4mF family antitoxin [Burkholderiales bacterium]
MTPKPETLPDGNEPGRAPVARSSADLGAIIRDRRKQLALTQLDLAGLANSGNRFIVEVENGKPTVQLQKVLDLLQLLGLELVVRAKTTREP